MQTRTKARPPGPDREALQWIARQLRWERTLDVLRGPAAPLIATSNQGGRKAA